MELGVYRFAHVSPEITPERRLRELMVMRAIELFGTEVAPLVRHAVRIGT